MGRSAAFSLRWGACLLVAGCGNGMTSGSARVTLASGFDALPVFHNDSASSFLQISRDGGYAGPVRFVASGAPGGMTVALVPETLSSGVNQGHVIVRATPDVAPGPYLIRIAASGDGIPDDSISLRVIVYPTFAISAAPFSVGQDQLSGTTVWIARTHPSVGPITLYLDSVPLPATMGFGPSPADGDTSHFGARLAADAIPGIVLVRFGASSAAGVNRFVTIPVTILPVPNFTIRPAPSTVGGLPGTSTEMNAVIERRVAFTGPVRFSVQGLDPAIAVSFDPNPSSGAVSRIRISIASNATPGVHQDTVIATFDTLTRSFGLNVVVPPPPDFDLVVTPPPPIAIVRGTPQDILIDVLRVSGLDDPVSVRLEGLPTGTSVGYSDNPVPFSRTIVTLAVPSSAAPGSYSVTAIGTAAGITHAITFTLDVS